MRWCGCRAKRRVHPRRPSQDVGLGRSLPYRCRAAGHADGAGRLRKLGHWAHSALRAASAQGCLEKSDRYASGGFPVTATLAHWRCTGRAQIWVRARGLAAIFLKEVAHSHQSRPGGDSLLRRRSRPSATTAWYGPSSDGEGGFSEPGCAIFRCLIYGFFTTGRSFGGQVARPGASPLQGHLFGERQQSTRRPRTDPGCSPCFWNA